MPRERYSAQRDELQSALGALRGAFLAVGSFSLVINLLMLMPAIYMLQIYDRVLASRSEVTLYMLTIILLGVFLLDAALELVRAKVLIRAGAALDLRLSPRVFDASFERKLRGGPGTAGQALSDLANIRQFLTGRGLFAFFDAPWTPIFVVVIFLLHPWMGLFAAVALLVLLAASSQCARCGGPCVGFGWRRDPGLWSARGHPENAVRPGHRCQRRVEGGAASRPRGESSVNAEHPLAPVPEAAPPDRITAARALGPTWPSQVDTAPVMQLPNADYRSVVRLGLLILILGFGGIAAWAMLAPLDEGVPASGTVAVESSRKRIDHLNGGLVERILVREGQLVQAGDELLVLNETQSRSSLNATLNQWHVSMATLARLRAERAGGAIAIDFPVELTAAAAKDPEVAALVRSQEGLFRARRSALLGELNIIAESVAGLESQLKSLAQLKAGRETQIALFEEQLASYRKLRRDGFVSRNQELDLERQLAEIQSKQSEDLANIAGINARLAGFRMRGAQRETEYRSDVEAQLADVQREFATLGERLTAQRDAVSRLVLRAPVTGTVVDLATHTVGGVVKPGDRLMEIVPQGDRLVIEAKVAPQYIDRLRPGQPADVHFDAYSSRAERPVVKGEVAVVSADALTDARTGAPYYTLRVTISAQEAKRLGDLKLQAGMQATVMIKTGERSLFVYLTAPLLRRFSTAMTER